MRKSSLAKIVGTVLVPMTLQGCYAVGKSIGEGIDPIFSALEFRRAERDSLRPESGYSKVLESHERKIEGTYGTKIKVKFKSGVLEGQDQPNVIKMKDVLTINYGGGTEVYIDLWESHSDPNVRSRGRVLDGDGSVDEIYHKDEGDVFRAGPFIWSRENTDRYKELVDKVRHNK